MLAAAPRLWCLSGPKGPRKMTPVLSKAHGRWGPCYRFTIGVQEPLHDFRPLFNLGGCLSTRRGFPKGFSFHKNM